MVPDGRLVLTFGSLSWVVVPEELLTSRTEKVQDVDVGKEWGYYIIYQ